MVRKAKPQAGGDRGGQETRSDDDILKDRKLLEAFDTADLYLKLCGLGMWVAAALWFFNFADKAPVGSSLYNGGNDVHLIFIVMGFFCRWIAQSSPRSWSGWRRAWHLSWCPLCISLVLALGSCLVQNNEIAVATMPYVYIGGGLVVMGLGSLATLPGPCLKPGKLGNVPLCRGLLVVDGFVLLALAVSIVMGAVRSHGLGFLTAAMTALPMASWALALMFCTAEAELLIAFPTIVIFCIGAIIRSSYVDGFSSAIPSVIVMVLHLLPYLPLPPTDADSNPFHVALRKSWRGFVRLMSQPVSGFGDDE